MTVKAYARSVAATVHSGLVLAVLCTLLPHCGRADTVSAVPPGTLLQTSCGGCHQPSGPGKFARISDIRKTPEGWLMTIFRMQQVHGLSLADSDRDTLVRYLADLQGLAPAETARARFALERRPNVQDLQLPGDHLQAMCARCHSAARIELQRRDAAEWLKLSHWHLAQFPTIEYQDKSRDRMWWQMASTVVPEELGKMFPLHAQAWEDWRKKPSTNISGVWRVRGREPGRSDYWGTAEIRKTAEGEYHAAYRLQNDASEQTEGESTAIVYTGFEWRGSAQLGERTTREVFALSEDGRMLSGRWFVAGRSEEGGDWIATRADAAPSIVAVSPVAARIGSTTRVTIFGDELVGPVDFGAGVKVKIVSRTRNAIVADVKVTSAAKPGYLRLSVGKTNAADRFAVYDRVDRLEVTPHFGIARLGGGKIDPVSAQFEATAYLDLPANGAMIPVRLGHLPVTWHVEPNNEEARVAQDVKYAGKIDATGKFVPAATGPNPERKYSNNNTGDLSVIATLLEDTGTRVVGKGHLIVTVQRWNNPPIY